MPKDASSPVADSSTAHEIIKQEAPRMPGGSIELLYCESCGGLILGGAKNAQPSPKGNGFYCKKCAAAAPAAKGGDTAPVLPAQTPETREIPKRRLSSASLQPARRESGGTNNRSKVLEPQTRSKRQTGVIPSQKDAGNTKVIVGAVAAGAVLLILGVSMMGGAKSDAPVHTASANKSESASERREPEKVILPAARSTPAPAPAPAPVIDRKAEMTPPAQPAEPEVPKEAKTATAAPAPEEKAPERDPSKIEEKPAQQATQSEPATELAKKDDPPPAKKPDVEEEDLNKPATPARPPSNPFSVAEGGDDPTKVMPGQKNPPPAPAAPVQAKPKPAYEKGKQSPLFPADRDSKTVDHQSPAMNQGQKSGINETKYDGWSWMGNKLDGWNVKSGVLSMATQGVLTLDGYSSKQFELSFEVDLGAGAALAIHSGSSKNGINLIMFVPNGVMTGVWDQTKTKDNVKSNKDGKPCNLAGGFVPVKIQVVQNNVEVFSGGKSVFKSPLPNAPEFGQFGIMCLGVNGSTTPSLKLKNVVLFTP